MISGTTGDHIDLSYTADLIVGHAQLFNDHISVLNAGIQCITYCLGLFIHFFEHKKLITAFFSRIYIPLNSGWLFLQLLFIDIKEGNVILCHADNLFILYKVHISCVFQHCRYVRSDQVAHTASAHDQGTVFSHSVKLIRLITEHDSQRIGAFHAVHDLCDSLQRIPFIVIIQQVGDDLCICLRHKFIAFGFQLLFQLHIVLNDPIMYYHNGSVFIKMRMSIDIRRRAVGCPSGVPDSHCSRKSCPAVGEFIQNF